MPARPGAAGGPSPLLPLAYLACAAVAFVSAAMGIVWLAPEIAGHYYHPRILALTHVATLGWITLAIMGASYQIMPIALERPIWSERLAGWQLGIVALAITGLVAHLALATARGLAAAAGLVVLGVTLHLVNVGLSLRGFRRWTLTARLIALGYGGLAATALLGLALTVDRVRPFLPGEHLSVLHAHVHVALLGWVAPMILGVAARVYPMFLLAPEPEGGLARAQLWGLGLAVPSVVGGVLGVPVLLAIGTLGASAAALSHGWWVVGMARRRRRPGRLDWGLRFAVTATGFIPPAVVLGLALAAGWVSGPRPSIAYAVVVMGGWVSLTIAGMMLKIVPFLVWSRVYGPRAGREPVPTLAALGAPRLEAAAYALMTGGLAGLGIAAFAGHAASIRAAGAVLAVGALAFGAALARILAHLAAGSRLKPFAGALDARRQPPGWRRGSAA